MNDLYNIATRTPIDGGVEYTVHLHPQHIIYQAHFPKNPITPGACLVQICQELISDYLKTNIHITGIKNLKFVGIVNPIVHPSIDIRLLFSAENSICSSLIYSEDNNFVTANFLLTKGE